VILVHEGRVVFSGTREAFSAGASLDDRFYALTAQTSRQEVA